MENVIREVENNVKPVGIFCYLGKAFDCIDHQTLFKKREDLCIRVIPLKWITSYLPYRQEYTSINHKANSCEKKYASQI